MNSQDLTSNDVVLGCKNTDYQSKISDISNTLQDIKNNLKKSKRDFLKDFIIEKVVQKVKNEIVDPQISIGDSSFNSIFNSWQDQEYDKYLKQTEITTCDISCIKNKIDSNSEMNIYNLEFFLNNQIQKYNSIINTINNETDIPGIKEKYDDYKKLLQEAVNQGDASEPRRKVKNQILKNKNLLAFVYLVAILGGSYYIYRYFKK